MKITYTTPIKFENKADKDKLRQTLEQQQLAFNICSELHFGAPKNSIVDMHAKAYKEIRARHPEINSMIVVQAERDCLSKYRSAKKNKHVLTEPIKKKNLSLQYNSALYTFKGDRYHIKAGEKRIYVSYQRYAKLNEMFSQYKVYDPGVFFKGNQAYFAFTFEVPEIINREQELACGIDLGIKRYAATSEGVVFQDKVYNKRKRELRYLKRQLQAKGTKSAKRHLKKIRHKEFNRSDNFCHALANKIIKSTKANVLVLEDLSEIKKKPHKYKNLNKISQVPFFKLRFILAYKAPLHGKRVETVNPAYTSQVDHRTRRKSGTRKGCRYYSKRGLVWDADGNAAVNIARRSKHPVSYGNVLDGQVFVSRPIVG